MDMRGSAMRQYGSRNVGSGLIVTRQNASRNISMPIERPSIPRQDVNVTRENGFIPGPGHTLEGPSPGHTLEDHHEYFQPDSFQFNELYDRGEHLSAGSYGTVYKCHHKRDPFKKYAVKILETARLKQHVFREMAILHELRSFDHVVTLIDYFKDESYLYMVQELAEGGDVYDCLVRRRNYTEKDTRDVASILLETVADLHRVPIVHRDLKPDNLLLRSANDNKSIMLADFGFARKIRDGERCLTRCGTAAYIAPEILAGQPYGVSVDLWSIGCLLYMLIDGLPPFRGENHRELFCKIRAGDYVFHESIFGHVSVALKTLISNLLTVNPAKRFTAQQALESDWFVRETPERLLKNDLSSRSVAMSDAQKKWKAAKTAIVWAAAQPFWNPDNVTFSQQVKDWDIAAIDQQLVSVPTDPGASAPSRPCSIGRESLVRAESIRIPKTPMKGMPIHCVKFHDVYELLKKLRSGSSATVWECRHKCSSERYAVKVINRSGLRPIDDENILTEVAMMQSLSGSKYCVQLLDFYEEPGTFYLVMEYMRGGDVFDRILRLRNYTEKDARDLATVLLKAISSMHRVGIAHRDIKPQNLLLVSNDDHCRLKVGDFGWSRRVHTPNSLTCRVGTPTYVAPEILKNIPHDERVDLWSVGVVIFVLLVGYPPFQEDHEALLFDKIRRGEWMFEEEDWSHISHEAKELLRGLLKVDPKERLTADQALKSRWININGLSLSSISLGDSITKIRMQRNRLRAVAATVMFMNNLNNTATCSTRTMDVVNEDEEEDSTCGTPSSSSSGMFSSGMFSSRESMDEDED